MELVIKALQNIGIVIAACCLTVQVFKMKSKQSSNLDAVQMVLWIVLAVLSAIVTLLAWKMGEIGNAVIYLLTTIIGLGGAHLAWARSEKASKIESMAIAYLDFLKIVGPSKGYTKNIRQVLVSVLGYTAVSKLEDDFEARKLMLLSYERGHLSDLHEIIYSQEYMESDDKVGYFIAEVKKLLKIAGYN